MTTYHDSSQPQQGRRRIGMKASGLSGDFYTMPNITNQTMSREDLRELLLDTGGRILTCGRLRTITTKHLGAGIYRVTLEAPPS